MGNSVLTPDFKASKGISHCCAAYFGARRSVIKLYNNQKMPFGAPRWMIDNMIIDPTMPVTQKMLWVLPSHWDGNLSNANFLIVFKCTINSGSSTQLSYFLEHLFGQLFKWCSDTAVWGVQKFGIRFRTKQDITAERNSLGVIVHTHTYLNHRENHVLVAASQALASFVD